MEQKYSSYRFINNSIFFFAILPLGYYCSRSDDDNDD
jgi:hypothetical protein